MDMIYIAIPTYDYRIDVRIAGAICEAMVKLSQRGVALSIGAVGGCSLIVNARNELVAKFMATHCSYLLFVDSDLIFSGDAIVRAYESMKHTDVFAGCYPQRKQPITFRASGLGPLDSSTGLMPIERAPGGFMMVPRHILQNLWDHYPKITNSATGSEVSMIFSHVLTDEGHLGEDYVFCDRIREAGYSIHTDPGLQFGHVGLEVFRGRLIDTVGRQ
ncbi:MAG: hypothetical protein HC921_15975 [Synechococcaceae cyanobacterium SM2_3_1]|nr:hypothetical protein [Synechococcaceae cyanobacterium SM2_3_1]